MKKSLFILIVMFAIIILILTLLIYNRQKEIQRAEIANLEYERYTTNNILGSSLMTLINKVIDNNEKNDVEKDEKNLYISNENNSVIIEVKFIESDDVFRMEAIAKQGSEAFIKNYNTMSFKCMKKEYHEKTKNISYLYFEQV
ncbi:MAG: hypothetical protein J6A29_06625 [Clostridia bacterium]|nr:hypothetical protein [Clostridia bacterium]